MKRVIILIIAIVVVALIGLGFVIFNGAYDKSSSIAEIPDSNPIATHNSVFEQYLGKNKSVYETKLLVRMVMDYNNNNEQVDKYGVISISKQDMSEFKISSFSEPIKKENAVYDYTLEIFDNIKPYKQFTIGVTKKNVLGAICEIGIYEQEESTE